MLVCKLHDSALAVHRKLDSGYIYEESMTLLRLSADVPFCTLHDSAVAVRRLHDSAANCLQTA
jgi:hypothetical protein